MRFNCTYSILLNKIDNTSLIWYRVHVQQQLPPNIVLDTLCTKELTLVKKPYTRCRRTQTQAEGRCHQVLFRHITPGGDQFKMELASCVRLADSIVGMKILTSKAKIRLSCPVFPQPQCVFGINFYWKTVLPSNAAWNKLRWSTLPYHCIFTGYCSNTNKDQVDWHAVKNWSLVNWSNQFCITQMGSPGIPHSLDFFITTVSVKMVGTLWGLLVPSMLVYKIWWPNRDKQLWEGRGGTRREKTAFG